MSTNGVRRGVWFAGELSVERSVGLSQKAEAAGIDSVWAAEGYYARDAFTLLAAIASGTTTVSVATGVVNCYTRHPLTLAMSFATLDELSGGRVLMGIGSGERLQIHDHLAYDFSRPGTAVREASEILRAAIRGDALDTEGTVFSARGVQLAFRPPRTEIPLYIAAVGQRMCQIAGSVADGVFFPPASTSFIEQARRHVEEGATQAGRDIASIDVAAMIVCAASGDVAEARRRVAPLLGLLLTGPPGETMLADSGLDPAGAQQLRDALASGGIREMASAVTPEMIDHLAVAGTVETCRERVQEYIDAGVTHPVVSLIGPEPELAIDAVAAP